MGVIGLLWQLSVLASVALSLGEAALVIDIIDYSISTIAGTGSQGYSGDDGAATLAILNCPLGMSADSSGNIYFVDTCNQKIRRIAASTGIITTIAGTGSIGSAGDGGAATAAQLYNPHGLYVDSSGNIYIADLSNQKVRKVTASTGIITTIAGTGRPGFSGDGGAATAAQLFTPEGVVVDSSGSVYIADWDNHRIRKVAASTGIITTIAGTGSIGTATAVNGDGGAATAAQLNIPQGVSVDSLGNVYIADSGNQKIRKVAVSTGIITTIAGTGSAGSAGDGGAATAAQLNGAHGVSVDSSGNVYIADSGNQKIRKLTGI